MAMTRLRTLPALVLGASALTLTGCGNGDNVGDMLFGGYRGPCWLIHVILVVVAFVKIANSTADTGTKLLWGAIVFFFPVVGLIAWWLWGPKG